MATTSILIVEDDRFLQQNLVQLVSAEGYTVRSVTTGREALDQLEQQEASLVILDLGLPDMDGMTLCRRIRTRWQMPIIMLTARTDAMDKVMGLDNGADDYLTKPFEPMELTARLRAQLRRAEGLGEKDAARDEFKLDELRIDFDTRSVYLQERRVDLTPREYDILHYLAKNRDRAIAREQIFETIWGYDMEFNSNSLDVCIYRIRKKIEQNPDQPRYLHTLRSYGFMLGLT